MSTRNYAVIVDGVVTNVIVWDGESDYPNSAELVSLENNIEVGPGWLYNGTTFSAPVEKTAGT